jgi:hypothetical protein
MEQEEELNIEYQTELQRRRDLEYLDYISRRDNSIFLYQELPNRSKEE